VDRRSNLYTGGRMITRQIVLEYLGRKGWEYKTIPSDKGDQALLKRCPLCGDQGGTHFYMAIDTGQWYCHKCGEAGSLFSLKRLLKDVQEVKAFQDLSPKNTVETDITPEVDLAHNLMNLHPRVLRYLQHRHFSPEAIDHFKIGVSVEDGKVWIWYPFWRKGKILNVKKRTMPPDKEFRRHTGGPSILFNEDAINPDELIICEGESDALSLWSIGVRNVVGVPIGAQGIKPEWIDQLDKVGKIYIAYDSDEPGQIGASKLATRLGIERTYNILLPVGYKDVNEYLSSHSLADWQELQGKAQKFDVETVRPLGRVIQDVIRRVQNGGEEDGIEFPWPSLSKLTGRMKAGDLWCIGSKPKVGKTTFTFNLMYHIATSGIPSLLFELEMPPERMLPRIVSLHLRKPDSNNMEDLATAYKDLSKLPFYFAHPYHRVEWQFIADTIRSCVRRYNIGFVAFDNLHFLARKAESMTQEISALTQSFKLLAEELSIPILIIARPSYRARGRRMTSEDLMWSADIEADADAVIILHREEKNKGANVPNAEGVFEPSCLVNVDRIRYAAGGACHLQFHDEIARVEEEVQ
jgi:5S rRNA maturation endonuclease (ribonuclease M5)